MPPEVHARPPTRPSNRGRWWLVAAGFGAVAVVAVVAVALIGSSGSSPVAGRAAVAEVEVVQTTANLTEQLTRMPALAFGTVSALGLPVIDVDDAARYQRIVGVGAAMTDASAWLIQDKLSPNARTALMRNLFASGGIGLRVLRVPMAASDFTRGGVPYSYDDLPPGQRDPSLARFSVAHDDAYMVPALQEALALDPRLELLANPWSPPAWMKTNQALSNVAGKGRLRAADYGPLAEYFVKFIQAYADRGIPIAAITPENEPGTIVHYPALQLSAAAEARFVARYLAPALKAASLHPMVYGPDANWLRAFRAQALLGNPAALTALAGLAWHCYQGNPDAMSTYHRLVARLDEIVTECSPGLEPGTTSELLIASIRNWASSVTLWNVALDQTGAPV